MRTLLAIACLFATMSLGQPARALDTETEVIWDTKANARISFETFIDRIEAAPRIIIGERHGFAPHQDRVALILQALAERGRYPRLVMEVLKPEQMPALNAYRARNPEYAGGLGEALEWWNTGWPAYSFYAPIFETAFLSRLEIVAGEKPEDFIPQITENREALEAYWRDLFSTTYCLQNSPDLAQERTRIQISRDAWFFKEQVESESFVQVIGRDHLLPAKIILGQKEHILVRMGRDKDKILLDHDYLITTGNEPDTKPCPS